LLFSDANQNGKTSQRSNPQSPTLGIQYHRDILFFSRVDGYTYIHNQWLTCVADEEQQEQDDETERNQSRCAPHCEFTISEAVVTPQTLPEKMEGWKDDDARQYLLYAQY